MDESILIIEDEVGLIKMLKRLLDKEGFKEIYQAESGTEALKSVKEHRIDLILLDVMLPDTNGFDLCQQIREISDVPIIFLTARTTDIDKLTGFSMGGDDYITKPFNPLEVAARIKAILHRQRKAMTGMAKVFQTERFALYYDQAKLIVDGKEVNCPAKEFQLLKFMCQHPNQVFRIQQDKQFQAQLEKIYLQPGYLNSSDFTKKVQEEVEWYTELAEKTGIRK